MHDATRPRSLPEDLCDKIWFQKVSLSVTRVVTFLFVQLRVWLLSVGTDGLPCLMVAAIVRLGLILKVLVHVHVVVTVGGVAGQIQGSAPAPVVASAASLGLHSVRALDDRDGGFGAGRVTGAV